MRTFLDISTKPLSNAKVLIGIQKLPVKCIYRPQSITIYVQFYDNMYLIKVVLHTNNMIDFALSPFRGLARMHLM